MSGKKKKKNQAPGWTSRLVKKKKKQKIIEEVTFGTYSSGKHPATNCVFTGFYLSD